MKQDGGLTCTVSPGVRAIESNGELVVYIVDADAAVQDSVASLVRSLGAQARCFENAEACLEAFEEEVPGCLITEVSLPGMSGMELLAAIRAADMFTPTIFLALQGDVSAAVHAMRSGAVDYIEKPFIDRQLSSRIRELCGMHN